MFEYRATTVRVKDGDTVVVLIDLGFHISKQESVRLADIDTPERGEPNWAEAKLFAENWLREHPDLLLKSKKPDERDKYGRYLANVYDYFNNEWLNEAIRKAGYSSDIS